MQEHLVPVGPLPATLEQFLALRDALARTPVGGAAAFVVALQCYARDGLAGEPYLTVSLVAKLLDDDPQGYKNKRPRRALQQAFRERVGARPYIAFSYAQGTSPGQGYALPAGPLAVLVREPRDSLQTPERAKVFVWSTGADSPRPITLERNDKGLWKAAEWSSLEVGVRPPAVATSDDL